MVSLPHKFSSYANLSLKTWNASKNSGDQVTLITQRHKTKKKNEITKDLTTVGMFFESLSRFDPISSGSSSTN